MYETGTALQVRAFHVMPGMPPPEGERHAHDYRLDVVVRRDDLDDRGMVVDLDLLDGALRDAAAQVDGADLEQIRPADAEAVTVEVFAWWLRHPRRPRVGVRVRLRGLHRAALTAGCEHLLVRGEAPLRACRPGELFEQQLAAAPPHPGGQRPVPQ
jgi:6-pyruvoyltetrahydropterin/6-carboxytetrahydropterin synthase